MSDIYEYLDWRGDLTFEESPFNELDGMVLSAISYFPFELAGLIKDKKYTVEEAIERLKAVPDFEKKLILRDDIKLLEKIPGAKRFSKLSIVSYESKIDLENESQFFAMVLRLTKRTDAVVFRGTDNTLVGWKEDFNMSFSSPVPAQLMAVQYFKKYAGKFGKSFILAGHSKGGNLAIYAAAFSEEKLQKKIKKIYNYDGPGFDESVLSSRGYHRICDKIETFVPESSVVGMLLGRNEEYTVVKNNQDTKMLQHYLFTWDLMGTRFVYVDKISGRSKFIDGTLKEWMNSLKVEEREKLVDTVYGILCETDAKTLNDLRENWFKCSKQVLVSLKNLDGETKKGVMEIFKMLFVSAKTVAGKLEEDKKK